MNDIYLGESTLARELAQLPMEGQISIAKLCTRIADETETMMRRHKKEVNGNSLAMMLAAVELAQQIVADLRGEHPFACVPGCHLCCYLKVELFSWETYGIASYIIQEWPRAEVVALYHDLTQKASQAAGLLPVEYLTAKIPCAMLSEEVRGALAALQKH